MAYLSVRHCIPRNKQFRIDVVQIPLEALASQIPPQLLPVADISVGPLVVADPLIVVLGVVVQPNFGQSHRVSSQDVDTATPLVGGAFPKDVTNMGTRDDLQSSSAHPRLE